VKTTIVGLEIVLGATKRRQAAEERAKIWLSSLPLASVDSEPLSATHPQE